MTREELLQLAEDLANILDIAASLYLATPWSAAQHFSWCSFSEHCHEAHNTLREAGAYD